MSVKKKIYTPHLRMKKGKLTIIRHYDRGQYSSDSIPVSKLTLLMREKTIRGTTQASI